jgi:hypothetical protein
MKNMIGHQYTSNHQQCFQEDREDFTRYTALLKDISLLKVALLIIPGKRQLRREQQKTRCEATSHLLRALDRAYSNRRPGILFSGLTLEYI